MTVSGDCNINDFDDFSTIGTKSFRKKEIDRSDFQLGIGGMLANRIKELTETIPI
jgi:hypothetical protein